jgi:hypothetical protein
MESTVFFERKLFITPTDFKRLKKTPLEEMLLRKAQELLEKKCSEHGYLLPGTLRMLSRSMGYFEAARFTGDAVYYVKLEGRVIYPVDGQTLIGEVIRKNKMGLYVNYKNAIHIQIPRDLHLDNQEYDEVEVGQWIRVVLKRSKFAVYDPYILASGLFIEVVEEGEEDMEREEVEDEDEDMEEMEKEEEEAEEEAKEAEAEAEEEEEEAEEGA